MKKILDILAIILPFILIVFGFMRVGVGRTTRGSAKIRLLNSLTMLIAIALLLIGGIRYLFFSDSGSHESSPKPLPMTVSKHSDVFNNSIGAMLTAYYDMNEGFVNWDTTVIDRNAKKLKEDLDSLKIDELKADTTGIYESAIDPLANARSEADNILNSPSIAAKRTALNNLSQNLRLLFIIVKYDREKMYWQECPMAFGDDQPGNWLSKKKEVRNPYLGNKHPEYKDSMLECGGPKDTINFIPVDTTAKK